MSTKDIVINLTGHPVEHLKKCWTLWLPHIKLNYRSAFIGSILNFTILIFGFIAGNVFERFGARILMITGGSIAFVGYVASAFAPSVVFLYFRDRMHILRDKPNKKFC